mmetsp:Transcript_23888/g.47543  ORF Transcript_23888/g.47543 Transcript_23888/m.47543 type:complete len:257 (-) Transcript_23888:304-1074(-)
MTSWQMKSLYPPLASFPISVMTNSFTTQSKVMLSGPPLPPLLTLETATGTLRPSTSSPFSLSLLTVLGSVTFSCVQTLMNTLLPVTPSTVFRENTGLGVMSTPSCSPSLLMPSFDIFLPSGSFTSSPSPPPCAGAPGKGVPGLFLMNSSAFLCASSRSMPFSSALCLMSVSSLVIISSNAAGSVFSRFESISNATFICSGLALASGPPGGPRPADPAALFIEPKDCRNGLLVSASAGTSPKFIDIRLSMTPGGNDD